MPRHNLLKIEKPWAVYHYGLPSGIGIVAEESPRSVHIFYTEGQYYPSELWDSDYVKQFPTAKQAIDYYLSKILSPESPSHRFEEKRRILEFGLFNKFPTLFKQECLQRMHDVLNEYAQSQPKCTEPLNDDIDSIIDQADRGEGIGPKRPRIC